MSPLEQKIADLEKEIEILKSATDPAFVLAMKTFLNVATIETSPTLVTDHTQSVDEAGAASYDVFKIPAGFIRIGDYNVPYYN